LSAGDGDFAAFAGGRKRSLGRNFRCIKERPDTLNADLKGAWASSNATSPDTVEDDEDAREFEELLAEIAAEKDPLRDENGCQ